MVQSVRNNHRYISTVIHLPTLFRQLGNEKVILKKIPSMSVKDISTHLEIDKAVIKEKKDDSNANVFQELEKKVSTNINKAYCAKCDKSVEIEKFTENFCPTCYKVLSYKCYKCNLLFSIYSSLCYHLENSCKLSDSCNLSHKEKNTKTVKCTNSKKVNSRSINEIRKGIVKAENKTSAKNVAIVNDTCVNQDSKILVNTKNSVKVPMSINVNVNRDNKTIINQENSVKNVLVPSNLETDENDNYSTSHDSSLELNDLRDFQSSVLRKLCIPCNSKIFNPKVICCTICHQDLTVQCIKCEKLFSSLEDIVCHLEICNPVSTFCCFNCEYKTTERHFMKKHIKCRCEFLIRKSTEDATKIKICQTCKQAFISEQNLKVHQRYCASLKCDYCPYKTKHKASLTMHMNTHAKIRKLKGGIIHFNYNMKHNADIISKIKEHCVHCGQDYNFDGKRKKVGCSTCKLVLKWKCLICGKMYTSLTSTMNHVRESHTEKQQIIKCTNCQKEFSNCLTMKSHKKNCTIPLEINCKHCDFTTKYAHKIKIHHNEKHSDLPFNELIFESSKNSG